MSVLTAEGRKPYKQVETSLVVNVNSSMRGKNMTNLSKIKEDLLAMCEDNEVMREEMEQYFSTLPAISIEVPFSEEDVQDLMREDCTFDWEFNDVKVHIYRAEEDDEVIVL